MKEYKVIKKAKLVEFEEHVNQYIKDGWDLCGGVSVITFGSIVYYHQAITRQRYQS